jgi:hypothetical protein
MMSTAATISAARLTGSNARRPVGELHEAAPAEIHHLMESPAAADVIKAAKVATHRRYAGFVIARARQTSHLFQGRFGSTAMAEAHLMAAARYAALKPGADRTGRQGQLSRATTRKIKRPPSNGGCAPFSPSLEMAGVACKLTRTGLQAIGGRVP